MFFLGGICLKLNIERRSRAHSLLLTFPLSPASATHTRPQLWTPQIDVDIEHHFLASCVLTPVHFNSGRRGFEGVQFWAAEIEGFGEVLSMLSWWIGAGVPGGGIVRQLAIWGCCFITSLAMPLLLGNLHLSVITLSYLTIEPCLHLGVACFESGVSHFPNFCRSDREFRVSSNRFDRLGLVGCSIQFLCKFFSFHNCNPNL